MRTSILSGLHSYSLFNRRTWRSSSILRLDRYFNFADESIASKPVKAPRRSTRDVHGTTSTWTFGIVRVGSAQFKVSRDDLIFVDKLSGRKLHEQVSYGVLLMTHRPNWNIQSNSATTTAGIA